MTQEAQESTKKPQEQCLMSCEHEGPSETNNESTGGRYPVRERIKPGYIQDFVTDSE